MVPVDTRVMHVITRHLESLKNSIDGDELHGLIARALRRYERRGGIDAAGLFDLHTQLDVYARDPIALPGMRVRARLLQQHIASFLPETPEQTTVDTVSVASTPAPILTAEKLEPQAPPAAPANPPGSALAETGGGAHELVLEGVIERPAETAQRNAGEHAEKYQDLLRSEKDAWQAIYGTVKDYHKLKQAWMKSLDELAGQRDALEHKLVKATESLTTLETERDQMQTEIEKLRAAAKQRPRAPVVRLAMRATHRPGTLARRDAFVSQLEAEIKRVKRSNRALALGLIGLENLEALNARHGDGAAEAIMNCYVQEILSNFRAYDLVALYKTDEFAVLFPDTGKEGAQRALEKARKRATETHVSVSGNTLTLPRFHSALVLYSAGEDAGTFLKRAETALQATRTEQTSVA